MNTEKPNGQVVSEDELAGTTIETVGPQPIEARPLTIIDPVTVSPVDASDDAVKILARRVENQKKMIRIALSLTSPSQWTLFTDGKRSSVYPTGGAADTILRRGFGLTWRDKHVTVFRNEEGSVTHAVAIGTLFSGEQPYETFEGRRSLGGYINNERDLAKGALENMKSVAVRDILGLRFRTVEELQTLGLNIGELPRRAEFNDHKSQGEAPSGEVATVPFGKHKGKPVTELSADQLDWYEERSNEALADTAKAKYHANERRWLDAIQAERAARMGSSQRADDIG